MTDFKLNDFGFSTVAEETLTEQLKVVDNRAKALYDAILPLLQNLKKNPETDYIFWPNRTEKIDAFEAKITKIMNGE